VKNDPYSKLGGLDQLLFKEDRPEQRNNAITQQRDVETTPARDNEEPGERVNEQAKARDNVSAMPRTNTPAPQRRRGLTTEQTIEATRTRVSVPTGHRPNVRVDERHSHDIFQDQVRWMNRVKLDVEETYGKRVTSNAIVQLAIDLFIQDYEANGNDSALIATLVLGHLSTGGSG
jgi:hypothetical protein